MAIFATIVAKTVFSKLTVLRIFLRWQLKESMNGKGDLQNWVSSLTEKIKIKMNCSTFIFIFSFNITIFSKLKPHFEQKQEFKDIVTTLKALNPEILYLPNHVHSLPSACHCTATLTNSILLVGTVPWLSHALTEAWFFLKIN